MGKIIIVIEKSSDYYSAYSDNIDGIYAAGASIDEVKKDVLEAIKKIRRNLPMQQIPPLLLGEYKIHWKFDVVSFLEYYSKFISLAGLEKITGINQRQLSHYLNGTSKPRKKQTERITDGIHNFANELLEMSI